MQAWEKVGLIYHNQQTDFTHAAVPIARLVREDIFEVLFSARDSGNRSVPFSLLLDLPTLEVRDVRNKPVLLPGTPGEFDADGVMPTCLLSEGGLTYLYYIGWKRQPDVPFRNAIGLAVSKDNGKTFSKHSNGPILDRSIHDPAFVASCDILKDGDLYKMWYLSALKWSNHGDQWTAHYRIKSTISTNLLSWEGSGHVAIDFKDHSEYAISTPRVHKSESGGFKMWYSHRGSAQNKTYRIGYAESGDGLTWTRKDDEVLLPPSPEGWDSEMVCYPFVFVHKGIHYMLYNGNGYGKSGFGLARLRT
jgi:hypothetical protein